MEIDFSDKISNYFAEKYKDAKFIDPFVSKAKVEDLLRHYCEESHIDLSILTKVYKRGLYASQDYLFPGHSCAELAVARVKLFIRSQNGGDVPESYRYMDKDLAEGREDREKDPHGESFGQFDEITLDLAKLDLMKFGLTSFEERSSATTWFLEKNA